MLMRNQMISPDTDAHFGLPGVVASFLQTRVIAINHPVATLKWLTREQRERE